MKRIQPDEHCLSSDYVAFDIEAHSGTRYRIIIDCEEDSNPNEVRVYFVGTDEPIHRIEL